MEVTLSTLLDNDSTLKLLRGSGQVTANRISPPDTARDGDLVFISTSEHLQLANLTKPNIIIAHKKLKSELEKTNLKNTIVISENFQESLAKALTYFDFRKSKLNNPTSVHPTAIIPKSVKLGKNIYIGPYVVIGESTQIGDNSHIGANTVIGDSVFIGANSIIHSQVFIGDLTIIGNQCEIHPQTCIGSDGFGYYTKNGSHHKIPQIGKVIIGNHVEIGANCAIDRATLANTQIGDGTKIDNLCHISHNVHIGKSCLLTAGFAVAGSSKIGDYFVCGGQTSVGDHVQITNNVTLAGASVALYDIELPGTYGGNPTQPINDHLKTNAALLKLNNLRKTVLRLVKKAGLKEEND